MSTLEFRKKVGIHGTIHESWDATPPDVSVDDQTEPPIAIFAFANAIAEHLSRVYGAEVRWNFAGSKQGYLVRVDRWVPIDEEV